MRPIRWAAFATVSFALFACSLTADDGIWLINKFPKQAVEKKYGVEVTDDLLNRLQLASVRVLASGSIVSPSGLLFTNHHVASECVQQLSSKEHDYMRDGFQSASEADEKRCPGLDAEVLLSIDDVTPQIAGNIAANVPASEVNATRKANIARVEKECMGRTGNRCQVVTLYSGGQYHLYRYKRYDDVRLVFAPEFAAAAFGGDIDNFTYPRYCLDITFLRLYENGKPAQTPDYLRWSKEGVKEGDLVFVSGNPASTGRLDTLAQLEFFRDTSYPLIHARMGSLIETLKTYSAENAENKRVAADNLSSQQNSYKAYTGFLSGLRDAQLMSAKAAEEKRLREAVNADPAMRESFGQAWDLIASAYKSFRSDYAPYWLIESQATRGSELFRIARHVARLAEERKKPNSARLKDYRDSELQGLEATLFAAVPISPSMETAVIANYLEFLRASLGANDPTVRAVLAGKSPKEAARGYVSTSRLANVTERKRLAASVNAVRNSKDGMIRLALLIDPRARALRKAYDDRLEAVLTENVSKIAQARFRIRGEADYPDATFTLRISYGKVAGYKDERGRDIPYATDFAGLFNRAKGVEPFQLPARWLGARSSLNLKTPFDFVTTADTHGGNSGSPTVNTKGEIVGILFDGNIESLPNRFIYTDETSRSVHVSAQGIAEALRKVYRANRLLKELGIDQ